MQTIRKQMVILLTQKEMSARELSQTIGIQEKEVYDHLSCIARSVSAQRKKLIIQPSRCLVCGYIFEKRKRFTPPSRCPNCKRTHLKRPTYRIC